MSDIASANAPVWTRLRRIPLRVVGLGDDLRLPVVLELHALAGGLIAVGLMVAVIKLTGGLGLLAADRWIVAAGHLVVVAAAAVGTYLALRYPHADGRPRLHRLQHRVTAMVVAQGPRLDRDRARPLPAHTVRISFEEEATT